jgi:hypothetical protein
MFPSNNTGKTRDNFMHENQNRYMRVSGNHLAVQDWDTITGKLRASGVGNEAWAGGLELRANKNAYIVMLEGIPSRDVAEQDKSGAFAQKRFEAKTTLNAFGFSDDFASIVMYAVDAGAAELHFHNDVKPLPSYPVYDPDSGEEMESLRDQIGTLAPGLCRQVSVSSNHLRLQDWDALLRFRTDTFGNVVEGTDSWCVIGSFHDGFNIQLTPINPIVLEKLKENGFSREFIDLFRMASETNADILTLSSESKPVYSLPMFSSETGEEMTQVLAQTYGK